MCWADPGPTKIWYFSSGPDPTRKAELGQDQPGPATKLTGPERVWPSTRNQRGELFSPHPPACRPNVLHAEGNASGENKMRGEGKFTWRGRGGVLLVCRRCCGGGWWLHLSRLEEEGADSCRGEGKLSAGAVGVTEEGTATPVAAGRRWRKEDCCWPVKKLEGGGLLLWRLSLLRR